jgi:hypothetical protein
MLDASSRASAQIAMQFALFRSRKWPAVATGCEA